MAWIVQNNLHIAETSTKGTCTKLKGNEPAHVIAHATLLSTAVRDVTKTRNGEWGMENEEWGMGNGEWGMGNGEWGMGNGEWGMGNGEWGMGNGKWIMWNGEWGMGNG